MEELESQIAKLQLGNFRHTTSYVYVLAEKAAASDAELYVVLELPLFNPAAQEACEKISLAIGSTLKRAYKKPLTPTSFEMAIAQINEELGKLASMGQVHWINKLNGIIGVKQDDVFTIATCGKTVAYLFRNREFTDISCSSPSSHPLKTFENFASGKIKLHDLLILSTNQLFNHLSLDRIKEILSQNDFLVATQTIIELLKQNAGPDVAFGTILNLQVLPGQAAEGDVELENYTLESPGPKMPWLGTVFTFFKTAFALNKEKRVPRVQLPAVSMSDRLNRLRGGTRSLMSKGRTAWGFLSRGLTAGKNKLNLENFREFSGAKKFFLISALVLLIAFAVNIMVANHYKNIRQQDSVLGAQLEEIKALMDNAETSLLYKDENGAQNFLSQAAAKMPEASQVSSGNKAMYESLAQKINEVSKKIQKESDVAVTVLGGLASGEFLIKLPGILAVQSGGNIVSYHADTGRIQDGTIKLAETIYAGTYISKNLSAVYGDSKLFIWDSSQGQTFPAFTSNVPNRENFGGLAYYPTNSRIYVLNKSTGQITSFLIGTNNTLSRPIIAVSGADFSKALDITIDGSIYVLKQDGISKFLAGKPANDFTMPALSKPLSGKGKIYTEKDWKNLYVLDAGNNRVLILDKKGNLITTMQSPQFNLLKDFQVDEKTRTIYFLNDSVLMKAGF